MNIGKNKLGCCSLFFVAVALVWAWQTFVKLFFQSGPAGVVGFFAVIGGLGFFFWWRQGKKTQDNREQIARMADACDALASNFGSASAPGLSLKKGELVVGQLSQAGLMEYVSDGSSYSGMNTGVGLRITNGVTWNVGGSSGQLTRNPEIEKVVDSGSVIFTNQRVIFAGTKYTREWPFAKMVNVQTTENGTTIHMNVTGRDKVSGLTYMNSNELTPGIMFSVAQAYASGGAADAERMAKAYGSQLRSLNA